MINIKLSPADFSVASFMGIQRWLHAHLAGKEDALRADKTWDHSVLIHIQGAAGEMAAAKALGIYAPLHLNSFKNGASDLGHSLEVRYRSNPRYDLIVRKNDLDERGFILVRGHIPSLEVTGWIQGKDAKKEEFLSNYGDYGPAYFVPQQYLRPIEELRALILEQLKKANIKETIYGS